jgi:hypothetical protein
MGMCSGYQPTYGDVYFLAYNVYEVHNRGKQLCHLHIDGSPYDRIMSLGPTPSSLKMCYRMILSHLLLRRKRYVPFEKSAGNIRLIAYRYRSVIMSWEAHGWQMHRQDTLLLTLFPQTDI